MSKPKAPKPTEDTKLLLQRNGEAYFKPNFVCALADKSDQEAKDFVWKKTIKPSSVSLDMCIEEYQNTCDKYKKWPLKMRMKFEIGHAIHSYIGAFFAKECPQIYYKEIEERVPENVKAWYSKAWPEVPLSSSEYKVKCVLDFPALIQGEPLIMDWKTTWQEEKEWADFCRSPRIPDYYLGQLASYAYLYTKLGYFPDYPRRFGFTFLNMKMDMEKQEAWKEVYFDTKPFLEPIEELWGLLIEAVEVKANSGFIHCKNKACKTHGTSIRPAKPLDPWSTVTPNLMRETEYAIIRANPYVDRARRASEEVWGSEDFRSHYG